MCLVGDRLGKTPDEVREIDVADLMILKQWYTGEDGVLAVERRLAGDAERRLHERLRLMVRTLADALASCWGAKLHWTEAAGATEAEAEGVDPASLRRNLSAWCLATSGRVVTAAGKVLGRGRSTRGGAGGSERRGR